MIKKFFRGLTSFLLKLTLFNLALFAALLMVFGTPTQIKKALSTSKLYDNFVANVLEASQKEIDKQGGEGKLPLDQPAVQAALKKTFPPEFIQSMAEQIIDSTYDWINGKTSHMEYTVDLKPKKAELASGLADAAAQRFSGLPACTAEQLQTMNAEEIDPFQVACQPPGLTATAVHDNVQGEILKSDLLEKPLTLTTNPSPDAGVNYPSILITVFAKGPEAARRLQKLPYALAAFAALMALALVLLHAEKRKGLHSVGFILVGTGVFILLTSVLLTYVFGQVNQPSSNLGIAIQGGLQQSLIGVIRSLQGAVHGYLIKFSVGYVLVGGAILAGVYFTKPKKDKESERKSSTDKSEATDAEPTAENKDEAPKKPKKEESETPREEPTGPPPLK